MLGDWSSVFQLLCAYTLIVGGYVHYKAGTEKAVERMLDDATVTLKRLRNGAKPAPATESPSRKMTQFEWLHWKKLSLDDLNVHRGFLTEWYWRRKMRTRRADERRNSALIYIGAIGFMLLLMSAAAKELEVAPLTGTVVSLALWVPVFLIMMSTWIEDQELQRLSQATKKPKKPPARFSNEPFPGMIYAVANHIRRLEIAAGSIP